MAFPAGLQLITVNGQFDEFPDGGAAGSVLFTYDGALTSAVDHSVVPVLHVSVVLDTDGSFSAVLPATNDPGWTPQNFTYRVVARVGSSVRLGTISLDYQTTTVDFDTLIQWDESEVTPGTTYATLAQLTSGLAGKANSSHTHTVSQITDFVSEAWQAWDATERASSVGEYVLRRDDASFYLPLQDGRMFMSHFRAATSQTILTVETRTGDQAATLPDNAWIGFLKWTGTQYTLEAVSVDDPTRWTAANTTYDTQVFRTDDAHFGAPDLTRPGFIPVADTDYIFFLLWNGSGTPPEVLANQIDPASGLVTPRKAVYIDLAAPPSSALMAEWVAGTERRFQGHMKR